MRILLTNDDGIQSPGLWALYHHLKANHTVSIIAPDKDKSGCSHSFSLKEPIKIKSVKSNIHICYGSPADCVFSGLRHLYPSEIDVVISGVNPGPNLGTDIIYSGTAAGARESAIKDIPGIALSMAYHGENYNYNIVKSFLNHYLDLLVQNWASSFFYNINFPKNQDNPEMVKETIPARRYYHDHIHEVSTPSGEKFLFIRGEQVISSNEPDSDTSAVNEGFISLCRVSVAPVAVDLCSLDFLNRRIEV